MNAPRAVLLEATEMITLNLVLDEKPYNIVRYRNANLTRMSRNIELINEIHICLQNHVIWEYYNIDPTHET